MDDGCVELVNITVSVSDDSGILIYVTALIVVGVSLWFLFASVLKDAAVLRWPLLAERVRLMG